MPISKRDFHTKWPAPVRQVVACAAWRALLRLIDDQAGTVVTFTAMVSAIGAAFVAVGLVEYSLHPEGSPAANSWTIVGFVLLVGAASAGLFILFRLVRRIAASERWRAHITQLVRQGQLISDRQRSGTLKLMEMENWYAEVRDALIADDPTGAAVTSFEDAPAFTDPAWFTGRVDRLMEYLRGLP